MNLDELYQEIILDHFKRPRHLRVIEDNESFEEAFNPNCGDKTRVTGQVDADVLKVVEHHTRGCAISIASASIMCERLSGKPADECREVIRRLIDGLHEKAETAFDEQDPLAALLTVKRFPMRIKCATLSWEALERWLAR